jgi:hypothetical protein
MNFVPPLQSDIVALWDRLWLGLEFRPWLGLEFRPELWCGNRWGIFLFQSKNSLTWKSNLDLKSVTRLPQPLGWRVVVFLFGGSNIELCTCHWYVFSCYYGKNVGI